MVPVRIVSTRPSAATESLTDRTVRAGRWRLASALVSGLFQFAIAALLARLLSPEEFGLVTLAMVVIGFARFFSDLGIAAALVQRRELTERHIRSAFTISAVLGAAMAALLGFVAPLGGVLLNEPRVTPILRALALSFVVQGCGLVAGAQLRRSLNFRRLFFIDVSAHVSGYGGAAITLALLGYGVWSLVWGALTQALLGCVAQYAATRHPLRPLIGRHELRELLGFGLGASFGGVVNYAAINADNFIVGRFMGAAALGLYSRAYNMMNLPQVYVASVISGVLFPALSEVQGEPDRLRNGFLKATELTAMAAGPVMAGMVVAAPHLVVTLYGPHWTGSIAPLQILCGAGYFRALYHLGGVTAYSAGRVPDALKRQVLYAALVITGSLVGIRFGITGVAAGVAVAVVCMYVLTGQLAMRVTAASWGSYLRSQVAAAITTLSTLILALMIRAGLEAFEAPSPLIAIALIAACMGAWSVGILWKLGEPAYAPLRAKLPPVAAQLTIRLRSGTRLAPESQS
jgi:O-antigen/teichoic acid export membrane protein